MNREQQEMMNQAIQNRYFICITDSERFDANVELVRFLNSFKKPLILISMFRSLKN